MEQVGHIGVDINLKVMDDFIGKYATTFYREKSINKRLGL